MMRIISGMAILLAMVGCGERRTRIEIDAYNPGSERQRFYGDFAEAWYRHTEGGRLEIVLRNTAPSSIDPTQDITQVMLVDIFWMPRPGTTAVESTQINAQMQYALLTPPTGVRYDGAGFVTWKFDKFSGDLVGEIESGTLLPHYRLGDAVEPFASARIAGKFRAEEQPARVIQARHEIETSFDQARAFVPE